MNLTIANLSDRVLDGLKEKAKASGRTVEAEAAAILSASLDNEPDLSDMDDLQRMVYEMYEGNLPKNEVENFLADRKREAEAELSKLS
jgi:hypothetical protein